MKCPEDCRHEREELRIARVPGTGRMRFTGHCPDCGATISTLWPPKFEKPKKKQP